LARCGRKGRELVFAGLELLGRGLLLSWLRVLRLDRQSKGQDQGTSQDGGKGQNSGLDFHGAPPLKVVKHATTTVHVISTDSSSGRKVPPPVTFLAL
jgi:hypothetical protein